MEQDVLCLTLVLRKVAPDKSRPGLLTSYKKLGCILPGAPVCCLVTLPLADLKHTSTKPSVLI